VNWVEYQRDLYKHLENIVNCSGRHVVSESYVGVVRYKDATVVETGPQTTWVKAWDEAMHTSSLTIQGRAFTLRPADVVEIGVVKR
jgi:hypothetical protein